VFDYLRKQLLGVCQRTGLKVISGQLQQPGWWQVDYSTVRCAAVRRMAELYADLTTPGCTLPPRRLLPSQTHRAAVCTRRCLRGDLLGFAYNTNVALAQAETTQPDGSKVMVERENLIFRGLVPYEELFRSFATSESFVQLPFDPPRDQWNLPAMHD